MRRASSLSVRGVLLAIWLVFALFPIYWTVATAFKTPIDIYQGPKYVPFIDFHPTVMSWERLFGSQNFSFFKDFANSLLFASMSALLAVLLGAFAAYGLAQYRYKLGFYKNDDIAYLLVSQRFMPPIVAVLAIYITYQKLSLLDSRFGMILAYTAFDLPLAIFLLRNFFEQIPPELEQAAAIDGYGKVERLLRVVFPLAAPGLAAAYMICFVFSWNDFLFALILTFDNATTLPIMITNLNTQMQPMWWLLSAVGIVVMVPPVVVAVFLDRYMQRQVLRGGVR